jgi:hypothetical protein
MVILQVTDVSLFAGIRKNNKESAALLLHHVPVLVYPPILLEYTNEIRIDGNPVFNKMDVTDKFKQGYQQNGFVWCQAILCNPTFK